MTQVFISYSRKDIAFIERLAEDLKKAGLDVWHDVSRIAGGARWRTEIENALRNSQYVIVVLSPDSIVSEWVEREFLFSNNLNRTIIPLMYRACEVPLNYVDLNYIDVQGDNYTRNFDELLSALGVGSQASTLPVPEVKSSSRSQKLQPLMLLGVGLLLAVMILGFFVMRGFLNRQSAGESSATAITDPQDVKMVLVPAGEFVMGSRNIDAVIQECKSYVTECDQTWFQDELIPHTVFLDDFYMDIYEVTNRNYAVCVDAGACQPPVNTTSSTRSSYFGDPGFDDYPVIFIDWNMAKTYCEWRGARLPTEAEWEKAARGVDERTYPWGEEIDNTFANYNNNFGDTSPVGSYESNQSPYGIYDMAGNVWEWVADYYSESYYRDSPASNPPGPSSGQGKVLRGGSWYDPAYLIRTTTRFMQVEPVDNNYGFRCARDVTP